MNPNSKKLSGLLLAAALLVGTASTSMPGSISAAGVKTQTNSSVTFTVNGKTVSTKGQLGQDGALIPLSVLRDALNVQITYDAKNKMYMLSKGQTQVKIQATADGAKLTVNGALQPSYYDWKNVNGSNLASVHLLTDFFGYRTQWNAASRSISLSQAQLNELSYTTASINKTDKMTTISVQYPVLSGMKNKEAQAKINESLKSKAEAYVQASLKKSKELGAGPTGTKNEFQSHYTVAYNEKGIFSIRELRYEYYGGAHGADIVSGTTFSLSSGKELQLKDLLKANSSYAKELDSLIAAKLKKEPNYLGGFKTLGQTPGFYLMNGNIVIYFQEYDYVPYAQGLLEYEIPFSALLPKGTNPFEGL